MEKGILYRTTELRKHAFHQFRKNTPALVALYVLLFLVVIALLAPVLANEKPLFIRIQNKNYFPAFSFRNNYVIQYDDGTADNIQLDIADWKHMPCEKVIWAPVPWSPGKSDRLNANYKGPGDAQFFRNNAGDVVEMPKRFRHLLGTGNLGDDLFAGLIHGTRISLTIGFISMAIASLIGLLLGSVAGYFGDRKIVTTRGKFWTIVAGIFIAWFYAFDTRQFNLENALQTSPWAMLKEIIFSMLLFIFVLMLFIRLGTYIGKIPRLRKQVYIPADAIISRTIEIFHSIPTFILIITIAAIARPSLLNLMILIGLTSWTGIARLTRAEFLRLREMDYIQAARSMGLSEVRIILRHALPNGIAPALVSIAFGIASAILIESGLSFLGVGVPSDVVTWGSLVNDGRENFQAWWLVIFPGVAIFLTVTVYNLIGEGLRDALDPREKK